MSTVLGHIEARIPSLTTRWCEVGRIVVLRFLRRKDAYVPLLLLAVFAVGGGLFQQAGMESPAAGTMLLNLGMTIAWASAALLAVITSTAQIGPEIEARTLHPLLARPLRRADYVMGRWLACWLACSALLLLLMLPGWAFLPKLETYDARLLGQTLLLHVAAIAMICAVGLVLSLMVHRVPALLITGFFCFGGSALAGFVRRAGSAGAWLAEYLPDPARLNLVTRYTDGLPALSFPELSSAMLYAVAWVFCSLIVATRLFDRRPL